MALSNIFASVMDKLRQGPFGQAQEEPTLSTGGTTGYHPQIAKPPRSRLTARVRKSAQNDAPMAQQMPYGAPQPVGYPGAGQPPMGYPGGQPAGYPNAGQPMGYPGTAAQAGYPGAYGMQGQTGYSGSTPQQGISMGSGYQGAFQRSGEEAPYVQKWRRPGEAQQAPAEQMQQTPSGPNNVSYMPNLYVDERGDAFHHVERLTQPMSAATCYRLIEFMRNGETVIVNTELIQDERENQRCLDLLYGAAYTMQCTFTRISAKSIYVIAPRSVTVIPYESIRQINERDQATRWPGAESFGQPAPQRRSVFGVNRAAGQ